MRARDFLQQFERMAVALAGCPGHAELAGPVAGGVGCRAHCCDVGGFGLGGGLGQLGVKHAAVARGG